MRSLKTLSILIWALLLGFITCTKETSASETSESQTFGVAEDALPGFFHTGIPYTLAPAPRLSLAGTGRYGLLESMGPVGGRHQEWGGRLAVGAVLFPWFCAAVNFDGKYQKHPADDEGDDYSIIGTPSLKMRLGGRIKKAVLLGGELGIQFPGSDAPSIEWSATSITTKVLATFIPWAPFHLGVNLGFKLDNSANGVPPAATLRPGDRIALNVSQSHSLVSGIAMSLDIKALTLIVELNSQLGLGKKSSFKNSPMMIALGARYQALSSLSFDLYTDTLLTQRPDVDVDAPLLPTPPRFAILLGARYTWSFAKEAAEPNKLVDAPVTDASATGEPVVQKDAAPRVGAITGQILDEEQLPIADAEIHIAVGEKEVVVNTDSEGNYTADNVPIGTATVTATAEYFDPLTFEVAVAEEGTVATPPKALIQSKVGSQVRGLVRDTSGNPLDAVIRVLPDRTRAETNNEGFFEIDVEPGKYTIAISAVGYIKQKHTVSVGDNSVVILNVDLSKK